MGLSMSIQHSVACEFYIITRKNQKQECHWCFVWPWGDAEATPNIEWILVLGYTSPPTFQETDVPHMAHLFTQETQPLCFRVDTQKLPSDLQFSYLRYSSEHKAILFCSLDRAGASNSFDRKPCKINRKKDAPFLALVSVLHLPSINTVWKGQLNWPDCLQGLF